MYERTTQGEEGMATLREFMQTVNTSTPVEEEKPW
jgi:hypothetical protein